MKWAILAFVLYLRRMVEFSHGSGSAARRYIWPWPSWPSSRFCPVGRKQAAIGCGTPLFSHSMDIILVTAVTYFSDGIQSPFYPLYYMTVITAAVDFGL